MNGQGQTFYALFNGEEEKEIIVIVTSIERKKELLTSNGKSSVDNKSTNFKEIFSTQNCIKSHLLVVAFS